MVPPRGCTVTMVENSTMNRSETWLKTLTLRQEKQQDTVSETTDYLTDIIKHSPRSSRRSNEKMDVTGTLPLTGPSWLRTVC